jgi:hypothetical protein
MDGDVEPSVRWAAALQSGYLLADIFDPPMKKAPAFTGALLMARSAYFFARVFFAFFAFAAFFAFFAMTTLQVGVGESDFTS